MHSKSLYDLFAVMALPSSPQVSVVPIQEDVTPRRLRNLLEYGKRSLIATRLQLGVLRWHSLPHGRGVPSAADAAPRC